MNHTPGPWKVSGVGKERLVFRATDTSVYPIATIELDHLKRFGSGDLDATARLIAAAPELYQSLKTLTTMLSENGRIDVTKLEGVVAFTTAMNLITMLERGA